MDSGQCESHAEFYIEEAIPLILFKNRKISSLEIIVKYLREIKKKKYCEIARLLNRDQRTIWATYKNSKRKHPEDFSQISEGILIPSSIFKDRGISVLELIVNHLKCEHSLRLKDIANMLNRSGSTIRTIHSRLKNKTLKSTKADLVPKKLQSNSGMPSHSMALAHQTSKARFSEEVQKEESEKQDFSYFR